MSEINTIQLIQQMKALADQAGVAPAAERQGEAFFNVLQGALSKVNEATNTSDHLKASYEMGDPNVSIAEVKIAEQKALLGFQATVSVRNKLVQAYQDIMNMPV